MLRSGAHSLSDYHPDDRLLLACRECGRQGDYLASPLMERFGDAMLPDPLQVLAQCERSEAKGGRCHAVYLYPKG